MLHILAILQILASPSVWATSPVTNVMLEELWHLAIIDIARDSGLMVEAAVPGDHMICSHTDIGSARVSGGLCMAVFLGHEIKFVELRYVKTDAYRGAIAIDDTFGVYALQSFVGTDRTDLNLHRFGTLRTPVDLDDLAHARVATASGSTESLSDLLRASRPCQHRLDGVGHLEFVNFVTSTTWFPIK